MEQQQHGRIGRAIGPVMGHGAGHQRDELRGRAAIAGRDLGLRHIGLVERDACRTDQNEKRRKDAAEPFDHVPLPQSGRGAGAIPVPVVAMPGGARR